MNGWIRACPTPRSAIEDLCVAEMSALLATIYAPPDSSQNLNWRETAAVTMTRRIGFEHCSTFNEIQDYIWAMTRSETVHTMRTSAFIRKVIPRSITTENFYAIIKLVDGWQFSFSKRGDATGMQRLLLRTFLAFWHTPDELRSEWKFSNDPILDSLEFLMQFYRDVWRSQNAYMLFKQCYINHFDRRYGNPLLREYLGFGVGRMGMSFARLRMEIKYRDDGQVESMYTILDNSPSILEPVMHNYNMPEMSVEEYRRLMDATRVGI
jgi:hypothetical protein